MGCHVLDWAVDVVWVCCACIDAGLVDSSTGQAALFCILDGFYGAGHCAVCAMESIVLLAVEVQCVDDDRVPV